MSSPARLESNAFISHCHEIIHDDWLSGMDIGLAGDVMPSGNYSLFCDGMPREFVWETLDKHAIFHPSIVFDLENDVWTRPALDLVICSNVLEHCEHVSPVMNNLGRMSRDWLLIDSPKSWESVGYHGTSDFGDFHRFSLEELKLFVELQGFFVVSEYDGDFVNGVLARKNKE